MKRDKLKLVSLKIVFEDVIRRVKRPQNLIDIFLLLSICFTSELLARNPLPGYYQSRGRALSSEFSENNRKTRAERITAYRSDLGVMGGVLPGIPPVFGLEGVLLYKNTYGLKIGGGYAPMSLLGSLPLGLESLALTATAGTGTLRWIPFRRSGWFLDLGGVYNLLHAETDTTVEVQGKKQNISWTADFTQFLAIPSLGWQTFWIGGWSLDISVGFAIPLDSQVVVTGTSGNASFDRIAKSDPEYENSILRITDELNNQVGLAAVPTFRVSFGKFWNIW